MLLKGCAEGVHKFEPRYSKSEAKISCGSLKSIKLDQMILEAMRESTYVCDVCVRCGATNLHQLHPRIGVTGKDVMPGKITYVGERVTDCVWP